MLPLEPKTSQLHSKNSSFGGRTGPSNKIAGFIQQSLPCCLCVFAIIFVAGSTRLSGQAIGDWPEFQNTNMERWNPNETRIGVNNVNSLGLLWSYPNMFVGSSPAVANGVVYVGSYDYNVYALNATTGVKLWSYSTGSYVESSPAVANGVVYVGSDDNNVHALNAATGAQLWSYPTGGYVVSSPAVANGVVYVGSDDNNVHALNAATGAQLWSYPTGGYVQSSPTVANGVVYVASNAGYFSAVNASTGVELWSDAIFGAYGSAEANGVVYVLASSSDNSLYALDVSTGAQLWSYSPGSNGGVTGSPAVANGVVYARSYANNDLYALNASNGALLWSYAIGSTLSNSSPIVANGVAYVTSVEGTLYAFSLFSLSLVVTPNVRCKSSWGPCSGNIVLANGVETTSLTAIATPPQQVEIALATNFGQVSNIATSSSGLGTGIYTGGTLSFGWNDTTTVPASVNGTIGSQQYPSLTQIFNYAAFDFHQSQVTDVAFIDANAMSAAEIQTFLTGQNSFLFKFVIINAQGGFIDQNGNGKLDKGEQVYVSSPPQECKAPCGPFALGSTGTLASSVFENAATTYGVNPEVLLATAEKENSLVVASRLPGVGALNWAMGCGKASDFLSQINCSANTFSIQFGLTPSEPFFLQPKFNVQHYVTGIGRQVVAFQIQTAATYAQYRYTPFIQTSATGGGVYLFESIWAAYGF